jgi:hypothetical protein
VFSLIGPSAAITPRALVLASQRTPAGPVLVKPRSSPQRSCLHRPRAYAVRGATWVRDLHLPLTTRRA